nr:hypothetical protein GCM10020092_042670 [Actinoplanes digitatis]
MLSALDREQSVAPPGFSRWLIPPAALSVHLCIGQVYATSVYKNSLIAHFDVGQTAIGIIFSIAIVMLGLSAALGGTWVEANGPRKAMFVSACFWASGFAVSALGIGTGQLWLVYLGYGFLGGIGLGIGYISPVSTLIKWFPDRPGLATGLAIMGFGGGALIASPLSRQLLSYYDPAYDPSVSTSVASGGALVALFLTLGAGYFVIMMFGVVTVRVPPEGWAPEGFDPATVAAKPLVTTASVSAASAIRTGSFWLLWIVLFCNVTAGIGILEQASPMIQDFFRDDAGVSTVAVSAAAGFVGVLSLFNMAQPVRLVVHVRRDRAQTDVPGLSRRRHDPVRAARVGRARRRLAVRPARRPDPVVLRRRLRDRARRTCATCSARSRSARYTAGC